MAVRAAACEASAPSSPQTVNVAPRWGTVHVPNETATYLCWVPQGLDSLCCAVQTVMFLSQPCLLLLFNTATRAAENFVRDDERARRPSR